ncbi:hypothetical protein [Streptomyces sp. NPDC058572]|uniref:hypothetical protein n=1 Tax=Streptomyces sp. NPDC058572 TaxID=3346546 RepID=UPI0036623F85
MTVDDSPVDHKQIATFGGGDDAAAIKYSVPLPGAYSFERIVPLDVPAEWFVQEASSTGRSLEELGVAAVENGRIRSVDPDRLGSLVRSILPPAARPSLRLAADIGVEAAAVSDRVPLPHPVILDEALDIERSRRQIFIDKVVARQAERAQTGDSNTIDLPVAGLGNSIRLLPLAVRKPVPRIALVETYQVSASLGDYGLGRTLQTFSLLPGERTTVSVETWRTFESTKEDSSSIFDSSDTSAQTRFTSALSRETGAAFQDQGGWAFSVGVKAEAGANFGIVSASASVETGFSANHQEARQSFSKDVAQSASEHAAQVNNARRQAVQSQTAETSAGGSAQSTVREVANTNLRRVLNFVFRELNQTYRVTTSLRSVKIAFYNGNSDSAEIVSLAEMPRLLAKHIAEPRRVELGRRILALITECVDHQGTRHTMLQLGRRKAGSFDWESATLDDDGGLDLADSPLSERLTWRIKPGPVGQEGEPEKDRVDGVVTDRTEVVLRTDSVVVEALLGRADALDPYASALQALDLRSREADIAWRTADVRRVGAALDLVAAQADGEQKVAAWERILGEKPDIEVVSAAATNGRGGGS